MPTLLLTLLSVTVVVVIVALIREVRLRRALQRILSRLLNAWRNRHEKHSPDSGTAAGSDARGPDLRVRHASISTTMEFYVGRNAEAAAEVLWEALGNTSGNTEPIPLEHGSLEKSGSRSH
jgi:hypothetical protein